MDLLWKAAMLTAIPPTPANGSLMNESYSSAFSMLITATGLTGNQMVLTHHSPTGSTPGFPEIEHGNVLHQLEGKYDKSSNCSMRGETQTKQSTKPGI